MAPGDMLPGMEKWLYAREAADLLGVSLRTLDRLDKRGITKPIQLTPNARRRYDPDEIALLLRAGRVG
jgi:DNA-binding transcriptional MerR regulator